MSVTITGTVAGNTVDAIGSDGGDGFIYFVCNGLYRVSNKDVGYCEKLVDYYQQQRWVRIKASLSSSSWDGSGGNGSIAGNKDVEAAVKWAVAIAADNAHGYNSELDKRWGPDYDCSSLVCESFRVGGGFPLPKHDGDTRSMVSLFTKIGFKWMPGVGNSQSNLLRGDILLNPGHHTEIYLGGGKNVGAQINEFGGRFGGKPGDQTGNEIKERDFYVYPWSGVLRYAG